MNPFRRVSVEEIKKRENDKRTIDEKIKALSARALVLLSYPEAEQYKQELRKQVDDIIKAMIRITDPDPIKDSFFTRMCLAKLAVLYGIIEGIEKDARR